MRPWVGALLLVVGCTPVDPPKPATPPAAPIPAPVPAEAPPDDETPVEARLDPAAPFTLWLGRGSGQVGLDVIRIEPEGELVFHRRQWVDRGSVIDQVPRRATLQLDAGAMTHVRALVAALDVDGMDDEYVDKDVYDGRQWILRVGQGGYERVVYFSNEFPDRIVAFAKSIDALLTAQGLTDRQFKRVPRQDAALANTELWDSLARARAASATP